MIYSEHRYWSVIHNARVARLSIADAHGTEHFAVVPTDRTRGDEPRISWRDRRQETLEAIAAHIERGETAGEVRLDFAEMQGPNRENAQFVGVMQ